MTDTGASISTRDAKRMFGAGYRGVTSHGLSGSGLGLFISRRIMESMNGGINWRSRPIGGNSFECWLPNAIVDPDRGVGSRMALLEGIECRLAVVPPYQVPVRCLLDRLGVAWQDENNTASAPVKERTLVRILCEEGACGQTARPVLRAWVEGFPAQSRILSAPFLESTLGPLLLELALERLSSGDKQG